MNFECNNVSRATLELFARLVVEANATHNLIACSTISNLWSRHVEDSAQLMRLIPSRDVCVVDLGSGAGFPGLVLAILGIREVHLVESIGKKAAFLRQTAETLGLRNVHIHAMRIEDLPHVHADILTARALKPLSDLLGLIRPLMEKHTQALLMKGKNAHQELTEARQKWIVDCMLHPSLTDPEAAILVVKNLKRRPYVSVKRHINQRTVV